MVDYKDKYSRGTEKAKFIARSNKGLEKRIKGGEARAEKFKKDWVEVNLNEVISLFLKNPVQYESGGKIIYTDNGNYCIVTDMGGGYLRILDFTDPKNPEYITIDKKRLRDFANKEEFLKASHYSIKKRGKKHEK